MPRASVLFSWWLWATLPDKNRPLNVPRRLLIPLLVTIIAGGFGGAFLFLKPPQHIFLHVIPGLLVAGIWLFPFGSRFRAITGGSAVIEDLREMSWRTITVTSI